MECTEVRRKDDAARESPAQIGKRNELEGMDLKINRKRQVTVLLGYA